MSASIHLNLKQHVGEVDPRIFSGFLEHLGRAIYEGVYDPGNPLSDSNGFRTDVLDALKPMDMPFVRYPGGNFVSNYDWRDGIGPKENRPVRTDFAWKTLEPNTFGVDEFMAWCKELGTEAMMAVNLGTLGPKEASDLVEYCNLQDGTYWTGIRRANGNAEPHGIKLWCLGNEMDGPWQAGHVPAEEYAMRAQQAARLMKGIDPTIELVLCGSSARRLDTYLEWDRRVLEYCWDDVEYISAHRYSRDTQKDSDWFLAEGVEIERILNDYDGLVKYVRGVKKSEKQVYVSFDEWNVWYKNMQRDGEWSLAPHLIEEVYNLEDALICAQYLNAFIRHADLVKVACLAQIVNVIAPILTSSEGLLLQSTYYPFLFYRKAVAGVGLRPVVNCPTYAAGARGDVPVLDVSATYDEAMRRAAVFIVNRSQQDAQSVQVSFSDARVREILGADLLTGNHPKDANSWENPNLISPSEANAELDNDGNLNVQLPALGLVAIQLEV